ncbi:unnamed protein product [Mytilus coruscus]|uniref:Reverse transcriptase domain-containing protein n=1 Tax=Mytilus coruscus TaxID=42192 RepID=A0A6J8DDY9_MYTCO|nr:unnamed protein product [Mytilus coruscus]
MSLCVDNSKSTLNQQPDIKIGITYMHPLSDDFAIKSITDRLLVLAYISRRKKVVLPIYVILNHTRVLQHDIALFSVVPSLSKLPALNYQEPPKYKNTFRKSEDIGFFNKIEHHIPATYNIPVRIPYKRIPPNPWSEVREYLKNALKMGAIQQSSNPDAASVVIIPKKNGKLRMLDLAHAFHQLPSPEDIEKAVFRVGTGCLYEYFRMLFGQTGSSGTFMRLMDEIFGDQNVQTILTYLDDILVFKSDFNETLERLEMVLSRLLANNLKIRPEKCQTVKLPWTFHL